jgi:hypothetical protein
MNTDHAAYGGDLTEPKASFRAVRKMSHVPAGQRKAPLRRVYEDLPPITATVQQRQQDDDDDDDESSLSSSTAGPAAGQKAKARAQATLGRPGPARIRFTPGFVRCRH